jgi:hypothetical protein
VKIKQKWKLVGPLMVLSSLRGVGEESEDFTSDCLVHEFVFARLEFTVVITTVAL